MSEVLDILIPTYDRPAALAVTLTSLCAQTRRDFAVVLSDQTTDYNALQADEVRAVLRVLDLHGHRLEEHRHTPQGLAEHREFLLSRTTAPCALFLDDDLILEPDMVERLMRAMEEQRCGFVGCGLIGLSYKDDRRPHEQAVELWEGPVQPETVTIGSTAWRRHLLHNAANLLHVQQKLDLTPERQRVYKVAWVGGCTLYDVEKLRAVGGFSFWRELAPVHAGEDVVAQHRVMARYGGCAILPSGVYHQELPTTIPDRRIKAERQFVPSLERRSTQSQGA